MWGNAVVSCCRVTTIGGYGRMARCKCVERGGCRGWARQTRTVQYNLKVGTRDAHKGCCDTHRTHATHAVGNGQQGVAAEAQQRGAQRSTARRESAHRLALRKWLPLFASSPHRHVGPPKEDDDDKDSLGFTHANSPSRRALRRFLLSPRSGAARRDGPPRDRARFTDHVPGKRLPGSRVTGGAGRRGRSSESNKAF